MRYLVIFIFLLSGLMASAQKSKSLIFEETYTDTAELNIDSILLIGVGSSTTNIFIDDVSLYITNALTEKKIFVAYNFFYGTIDDARKNLDTLNKRGYKAILFYLPQNDPYFESEGSLNQISTATRTGTLNVTAPTSRIDFRQNFALNLCLPGNERTPIWSALVEVSCDLKKSKVAKNLASKTLDALKRNGFIK